jgi:hypothetical protein
MTYSHRCYSLSYITKMDTLIYTRLTNVIKKYVSPSLISLLPVCFVIAGRPFNLNLFGIIIRSLFVRQPYLFSSNTPVTLSCFLLRNMVAECVSQTQPLYTLTEPPFLNEPK